MIKLKSASFKLLAILLCVFLLSSCSANSNSNTATQIKESVSSTDSYSETTNSVVLNAGSVASDMLVYENDDYYTDWKNENPNYIELNGTTATINGSGAAVNGSEITITAAGVYVLSGKLNDGQLIVDVRDKGTVKLVFNGMEINNADSSAIYIKNAGKTIISLQDGTQNSVTDGEKYAASSSSTATEDSADEPNATIFSKDNLTINGTGTLKVKGNYNNGIVTKDDLKITGGNININSVDDGLLGRDMVLVREGNITVEAGGDGIKATNDTGTGKGFIAIEDGTFNIKAGTDAIQGETSVLITGGKFTISSGGGNANGSKKAGNDGQWGKWDNSADSQSSSDEQSTKGIKAASDITISGGTLSIDSSDDALHSNNSINITGGDISIASGDDGIHSDASISIKGGKVNITKCYEGVESSVISVTGGETFVVSSDDGINVSGGNDGSSVNGRAGQNNFAEQENCKLEITGGYIYVDSSGDGLDSNGSITMTGGTAIVSGPTNNGNGAIDYNGTFDMSGGFLIAAGSSGMAEAPSEESSQYSISMTYSGTQQAGTLFHLEDSNGNTLVSFAPAKQYQSIVISSPDLKKDQVYTIYSGGTSSGNELNGLYTDGKYQGGTKVVDCTISSSVTWMSETGVTSSRPNQGGPGNAGTGVGKGGKTGKIRP